MKCRISSSVWAFTVRILGLLPGGSTRRSNLYLLGLSKGFIMRITGAPKGLRRGITGGYYAAHRR